MSNRSSLALRWAGEFLVIVLGVLVALAADRWSESRSDAELALQYRARLVEEIRQDSLLAAEYLERTGGLVAARDTLLVYLGGGPPPEQMFPTVLTSLGALSLPAPMAWSELLTAASLNLVRDPVLRETLSRYYTVDRALLQDRLTASYATGIQPYYDALYRIGWGLRDGEGGQLPMDSVAFREWPEMGSLLVGVGSAHGTRMAFAAQLAEVAGTALARLEGRTGR